MVEIERKNKVEDKCFEIQKAKLLGDWLVYIDWQGFRI